MMAFIMIVLVSMLLGVFGYSLLVKHGGAFLERAASLSRFSTPYNALASFAVCLVLFLSGHNSLPSSIGGALVVVGTLTVSGLVLRAVRALLSRTEHLPRPSLRRKKTAEGYWDFVNGEWVEVDPEVSVA